MKKIMSIILVCVAMQYTFGMGKKEANLSSIEKWENLTIRADSKEIVLTGTDILALEKEEMKTNTISSSGEVTTVDLTVISIEDLLEDNDLDMDDYSAVTLTASDGYVMTASAEEYEDNGLYVILTHTEDVQKAPRSCIPEKRTMYWVKNLSSIEFILDETANSDDDDDSEFIFDDEGVRDIQFFFENILYVEEGESETEVPATTLNYNGADVTAYSLDTYFDEFVDEDIENVTLIAKDGFSRLETINELLTRFVSPLTDGEEAAPVYFKEGDMGQKIKQLDYIIAGDTAIYFGKDISFTELFEKVDMQDASSYDVRATDGWGSTIPAAAFDQGEVYIDGDAVYRSNFGDFDLSNIKGNGKVKHLSSISVADDE